MSKGSVRFAPESGFVGIADAHYVVYEREGNRSNEARIRVTVTEGEDNETCWCEDVPSDSGGFTFWVLAMMGLLVLVMVYREATNKRGGN